MFTECNNKEQCKRNLVKTENYSEEFGEIFNCENCKNYYAKVEDNIVSVFRHNGKWLRKDDADDD